MKMRKIILKKKSRISNKNMNNLKLTLKSEFNKCKQRQIISFQKDRNNCNVLLIKSKQICKMRYNTKIIFILIKDNGRV